jgi:hypothetical protein
MSLLLLSSEAEMIIYLQPDILFTLFKTRLDINFEGPLDCGPSLGTVEFQPEFVQKWDLFLSRSFSFK